MNTDLAEPEIRNIVITPGSIEMVNGAEMKVLNVTPNSLTLRPVEPLVMVVRGIPMIIHKVINGTDFVLRRMTEAQIKEMLSEQTPRKGV